MKKLEKDKRSRFEYLLTKALDNLLDEKESKEFKTFINEYDECKSEWQQYAQLKKITKSIKIQEPEEEVWDMYWANIYNRLERNFAWLMVSLGAFLLAGYGAYEFVIHFLPDPSIPIIVKIGAFLLCGGLIALLISVGREKLFVYKSDPYKEIKR